MVAAEYNNVKAVKLLLKAGAGDAGGLLGIFQSQLIGGMVNG